MKHPVLLSLLGAFVFLAGRARADDIPADLARLKQAYQSSLQRIDDDYVKALVQSPEDYIKALKELEGWYQREGDLRNLIAVRNVREAFVVDKDMKNVTPAAKPEPLQKVQQRHIAEYQAIGVKRAGRVVDITKRYVAALTALQKRLTKQGKITEALAVMNEIESVKKNENVRTAGSTVVEKRPTTPTRVSRESVLSGRVLEDLLHGEVVRWNPMTKEISVAYDFENDVQLQDWKGGAKDDQGRLLAESKVVWLNLGFMSVSDMAFEGYRYSGDGPLAARLEGNLYVELGAGKDPAQHLLYQNNRVFPIISVQGGIDSKKPYLNKVALSGGKARWEVNHTVLGGRILDRPLRYPTRFGLGGEDCVSAFDNVTISGVLNLATE